MSENQNENVNSTWAPGAPATEDMGEKIYTEWMGWRPREPYIVSWWGDEMYDLEMEMLRNESPEQKAERLAREAAAEEKMMKGVEKQSVKRKEDKWCCGGTMKFRVPKPCKYEALFAEHKCARCERTVPAGQDSCSGTKEKPHLPEKLAGCWSHTTKTCIYIHPDEPQWPEACSGELCYNRAQRVFHLRTQPLAAPNRFVAVAQMAKEDPQALKPHNSAAKVYAEATFVQPKKPVVKQKHVETAW